MLSVRNWRRHLALAAAVAGVVGSGSGRAVAAPDNYTGTASSSWDDGGNWSLNNKPTSIDDASFSLTVPGTGSRVTLSAGETANSLAFNNTYELGGGDVTLTTGNVTVDPGPVGPGGLDGFAFGTTIASNIGGAGGLNKSLQGTLLLSGINTFTGTVNVSAGRLGIVNDINLGAITTIGGSTSGFNAVSLDGSVLQLDGISGNAGAGFLQVNRSVAIGSGGGTVEVSLASGAGLETANAFTGTATLTKAGLGQFFLLNTSDFAGPIVLADNGGSFDVRSSGALTAAASITINPGSNLNVDNQNGIANSVGVLASTNNQSRIANSIPIALNGGALQYTGRNVAGQIREVFGAAATPVTLNQGQSAITATSGGTTGNGGELEIANLVRNPIGAMPAINNGATVNFTGSGTLGTAGNSGRIFIDSINGGAGPANQTIVGGFATAGAEFAGYTTANGVIAASNAAFTGNVISVPASDAPGANVRLTVTGAIPSGGVTINSLSIQNATAGTPAVPDITFAAGTDTLTLNSGGYITSNVNRYIGTADLPGQITSGGPELFFHVNGSTTTVFSVIQDKGAQPVTLVKDQGGALTLSNATTPANNTYSGGTYVQGAGTLSTGPTANLTYLGTGAVFINNATLNQGARGATTSTAGYTLVNNAEIVLTAGSGTVGGAADYTAPGDVYNLAAGSAIYANSPGAGTGFNSLTRVATPAGLTAGGTIYLAPDAIIQYNMTNAPAQGTGMLAINNLGTAADLFFAPGNNPGPLAGVTVGTGTAYKGLSTDRSSRSFSQGTITANSDFFLQGLAVNGGYATLTLGTVTISNAAGRPINATLIGNVTLNSATANYPSDLTFVQTAGGTFVLQSANALGSNADPSLNARALIQAGAVFNIFPTVNAISGAITMQAGSRFLGDDDIDGASINGPGSITFQKGAIFDLQKAHALTGTATLNWEPGSILRLNNFSNPIGVSTRVGPGAVYEFFNGNPTLTSQATPENVTVDGGGFTNDSNSRTFSSGNGYVIVAANGTATLSATTNTTFTVQEDFNLLAGATLNIGLNDSIAGNSKLGTVTISQGGSRATTTSTVNVLSGYALQASAISAIPDLATLNLNAGASVSLNVNDYFETIGGLTGTGSVVTAQTGGQPSPTLRVGFGDVNSTFAGSFSNASGGSPTLIKLGAGTFTLTGVSTAATRYLNVDQGTAVFRDGGSAVFTQYAANRSGTLTLDNQVGAPLSGRLGTGKNLFVSGGTFNLNGANVPGTDISESVANLQMFGGGSGSINLAPGTGGATQLLAAALSARSITTLVLSGANLGAAPGAGNTNFVATAPSLFGTVAAGTTTTAIRPDILSASPVSGAAGSTPLGFTTQDNTTNGFRQLAAGEYASAPTAGANTSNNVLASAPIAIPAASIGVAPVDSQIQSLILDTGATALDNNTGLSLTGAQSTFVVKSGGILVRPGVTSTITTPYLSQGNPYYFHTYGNLTVNATLVSTNGFVKSGTGSLTLSDGAVRYVGTTAGGQFIGINDGTTTLGANNNSFLTATAGAVTANDLYLAGGSIDVNGNSQTFRYLTSNNNSNEGDTAPGTGGTLTNSSATPATLTIFGSGNINPSNGTGISLNDLFTGSVNGNLSLVKSANGNTLETFNGVSDFTGTTTVRGTALILRDSGQFSRTSAVTVDYGNLSLDSQYSLSNVNNRLPANVPVTLRGGTIDLRGNPGLNTTQALGTVDLLEGAGALASVPGQNGSTDLTIQALNRMASTASVIDFRTFAFINGQTIGGGTMGRYAPPGTFNNDAHITIGNLSAQQTYSGSGPSTTNGFIGASALVNSADYASYVTPPTSNTASTVAGGVINFGSGVSGAPAYTSASAAVTTPGTGGFTSGSVTAIPNIDVTLGTVGTPQTFIVGALRIGTNATRTLSFANDTDVLDIETGGLLRSNDNNATNIGSIAKRGVLTAGGTGASGPQDLFLHFNQNTATVNSYIADNGAASVRLVKDLGANLVLTADLGAAPTGVTPFSGGTLVNGGTLTLSSVGADGSANFAIPGDVTINNATVALTTVGQIKNTATLAVNNGGVLNLSANLAPSGGVEANQFAGLTFLNDGATAGAGPTVTTTSTTGAGSLERLVLTGGITAVNNNPGSTPTINGTVTNSTVVLDFNDNATNRILDVSGISPLGLVINAPIANGALTKAGAGMLALGGNTALVTAAAAGNGAAGGFTGGLNINAGQVRVDNANALSTNANTVTVGTGASDATIALITNNVSLPATLTTNLNGGTLAPYNGNTTLAGPVLVSAASTILVSDYYLATSARNVTLSGAVTGGAGLTVTGSPGSGQAGTLTFNNPANTLTGPATLTPGVTVTAQSTAGAGDVFTTGDINLQGGQLNLRDNGSGSNGILAYNNNFTVTGNATLNLDRANANSGNTFQFNNLIINNATLTTQDNGNTYQAAFTGTTTVTGNAILNHIGGSPVTLGVITGTGNLGKYGASQVNVTAPSSAFTGGTTVGLGTLRLAPTVSGAGLGTGPLNVNASGILQSDPGAGVTVTYAPSSVVNDGLIYAKTGTADFGTHFIGSSPSLGAQPFSAFTEQFAKPADVGEANFDSAAVADPHIMLENANTFLTPNPGPGKVGPGLPANGSTRLSFDNNAIQSRSAGYFPGNTEEGAAYLGTITVGGTLPAGPISFGTASDDGSSLYVDLNGDHVFTANERVVSNLGPHGVVQAIGTVTLAAGTYDVAVGYYQGTGGGQIEARFAAGTSVPYTSQFVFNPGGLINPPGNIQVDNGAALQAGGFNANTVTLNGTGSLTVTSPATNSAAITLVNTGSGAINVGGDTSSDHVLTVGVLSITGGQTLTKQGVGTLLVNGTGVGTGTLSVTAGTLGGVGSIAGPATLASGATLAPGNGPGPGVMTVAGPLALTGGSTYAVDLGGTTPGNAGNNYDQTNVTASTGTPLMVAGSMLAVSRFGSFNSTDPNQVYYILTQGGGPSDPGTFAGLSEGATLAFADGSGITAQITYMANWTGDPATSTLTGGNDIALYNVSSVPEPASLGLLALGGLGLLARRRRRRGPLRR